MQNTKWLRNAFIYVIIMMVVLVLLFAFLNPRSAEQSIPISQLAKDMAAGQVDSVRLQDDSNQVYIKYKVGHVPVTAVTTKEQGSLVDFLEKSGVSREQIAAVHIIVVPVSSWASWLSSLGFILPTLFLMIGVFVFMLRQTLRTNRRPASIDFDTKLRQLAQLRADGLISEDEFARKRAEILEQHW